MNLRKFIVLFFSIFVFFIAPFVSAQSMPVQTTIVGEHVKDFHVIATVDKSGKITVQEKIVYDFADLEKRGIFREIPYIKTNQDGKKFKLNINVISVKDENNNHYRFVVGDENQKKRIRIGDPDRTVTGVLTYVIVYEVSGALTYFSDHDELYWNVTGHEWTVPIAASSATVMLPQTFESTAIRLDCYTGIQGSSETNCTSGFIDNTASFVSQGAFMGGEGMTVAVGFPKNVVAVLEPEEYIPLSEKGWFKALMFILGLGIIAAMIFWYFIYPFKVILNWLFHGRDPDVGKPVTAWYEAPKASNGHHLTPAETGALVDETVDDEDITSTLVDLARRGYMKIEEKKKDDFYFHKHKEAGNEFREFELELFNGIFSSGKIIRLKDKKLYKTVETAKQLIYDEMVNEKFFPKDPSAVRNFYLLIAFAALFTLNIPLFAIALIFGKLMPRKTLLGAQSASIGKGLKNFLSSQERQLKFQADKQMMFEKLLPYAVAFGVEKKWAERFADIHLTQPDWYSTYDSSGFNSNHFVGRLGSSLTTFNRSAAPPVSSSRSSSGFSSGSGGGGFSGGGGGGGGGGSW